MGLTYRASAVRAVVLLSFAWSASVSAQARQKARTCAEGELRPRAGAADPLRVATADGRVSLVRPERMRLDETEKTGDDLTLVADDEGAAIMVSFLDGVALVDSSAFQERMRRRAETSIAGLQWVAQEVVEVGGVRWLRLEYTGRIEEIDHHALVYLASFRGATLLVYLVARDPGWKAELVRSAATLEVHDCTLPPPPLSTFLDSAALAGALAALPAPELPPAVRPLFEVYFDTAGAVREVEAVFDQIPASYADPVAAAIRVHLKPQAPSRKPFGTYLRVVAGPQPLVDRPELVERAPVLANAREVQRMLERLIERFAGRMDGTRERRGFLRHLLSGPPSTDTSFELELIVRSDGSADPGSIRVVRSNSRNAEADREVLRIAGSMRFQPGTIDGLPAKFRVSQPITIRIP
ncbi:MAG: hypothetical protein ACJ8GN_31635 [Longimicrobiaceae bacterium]